MVWYVVPCFRPRDHCHPVLTEEARAFFSLLSEDLRTLERSLQAEGGSVSLRWSAEAMNLLKRMQVELVALFKRSPQLPAPSAAEEGWLDQFMRETAALLDFCNSLKCLLSAVRRYRMAADLVAHKFAAEDVGSMNESEFERLEKVRVDVGVPRAATKESTVVGVGNGSIAAVMLAARATTASVSLILVSAVASPTPTTIDVVVSGFPDQLRPFADTLRALTVRFREGVDVSGPRFVLAEHEAVESAVGDLRARVVAGHHNKEREGFLRSVGLLGTSSAELREGVEMFDAAVDEVFDVVVRGRKEMLGMFRDELLSM
ncbi:uncharacterized protein M6B38_399045 [Iris pallida]|uniref:Uncharacterized protein n=1 Tax=Iris pallida TaxID=29817 RepID=A0AAX6FUG9_IRIPA|nr:uncharacterized protein M6B38_399045 [Iris pallida]